MRRRLVLWSLTTMWLCLLFVGAAAAEESPAVGRACKLFPQITDGIYNVAGQLVMNCQIASDGLTVTDRAWTGYAPGSGKGKRWNFNQTPYTEEPLVNYRFDERFSG
ncbi:MAG TPA: hypothetical protein PLY87_15560, partial [Planctomycetaceae bacterium]|nr:hypothetical protein [Planctomycetaceae bacterium]